ncbi:helix-turn-helix transcriptional regulator [Compostibacter hankyongensis]|uniref:Helix-turn-helix transcriptional regulator n=1 Tax=Compostibacter hankyongensis TaxID=1007089 RepID=A0ABP8FL89_9BACT
MKQTSLHNKALTVKNKIAAEQHIKVEKFRQGTRVTEPHKHKNYFEIVYLAEGSGQHTIDTREYDIKPPVVFFIRKEQVHHWKILSEPDGYVMILKKSFIDRSLDGELKLLLIKISVHNCLYLSDSATITQLFGLLAEEYKTGHENAFPITEGLLKALLAKILETAKPAGNDKPAKSDLYQQFHELLSRDKIIKNKVAHYAGLLSTTPQNLNAACRKAVNQPAAQVLSDFIVSEAKRLLLYTDSTVSEISFHLAFKDPSHFVKYFKRFTGVTPQSFRSVI